MGVLGADSTQSDHGNASVPRQPASAKQAEWGSLGGAYRREHGAQDAGVGAKSGCGGDPLSAVGRYGDQARARFSARKPVFRPVHAVGADTRGEGGVSADKQYQSAPGAQPCQPARRDHAVWRAEVAIDHGRPARQPCRGGAGVGRTLGIGEEVEARQRRRPGLEVESAGFGR